MKPKNFLIIKRIEELATIIFFCTSMFVLMFLTQALLLTWLNQFKIAYILISLFTSSLLTLVFYLRSIKNDIKVIPKLSVAVLGVILVISLILIFYLHDSFGGGDEGAYSGLAIILSKYHSISVPQYLLKTPLLYGSPSQAFSLTTPVYVVWLATQKVFFGVEWMLRSNVILVFLGLCSLFLVSSLIAKKSLAFVTVLLFSTCMPFLWFMRETMTENMAFFLLWFLILSLFLFVKTKKNYFLLSLFLSSWLYSFTRNEGLFMQVPVLITLTAILLIRKILPQKKIFIISTIYIVLIVLSFFVNNRLLPLSKNTNIIDTLTNLNSNLGESNLVRLGDKISIFTFQMLSKQNLSLALYSFFLVLILIVFRKNKIVKDNILYLGLPVILSVEFLKLINPSATLTQPWIYRRYFYALLPFGYLSLVILLRQFVRKKLLVFIFCGLLITNIALSRKIITLKNNWSITEKIDQLTQNISIKDFVIIDGDILENYYPMSYIAYHKEIRNLYTWWIEIGDWRPREKQYQKTSYSRLFLLSDKEDRNYKNFKLKKINDVEIESKQLQPNCKLGLLRNELGFITYNVFRLPYREVINYCSQTNNDILNIKKKIFLYEMEYNDGQQ